METAPRSIAEFYDDVPYESRPFAQSHPSRLAAIARLFNLEPPAIETARVLELGCSAGGNLIPMAAMFPDAHFVGIDLSSVQVTAGERRIAALGLANIKLHQKSISDITPEFGTFDYVICHGVYSWVPGSVQDAILRVARENLSDDGVAYVSYNVFPGWRLRGALREALVYHVQDEPNPLQRTRMARQFLGQLATATNAATAYGQMLRQEAQNFAASADYYITHEYFEPDNHPCYVSDFIAKARARQLEFLTESDFSCTIAETFGADNGTLLRSLSSNKLDRMEQYIDFLSGRMFRQSLLVRAESTRKISRDLVPARLETVRISAKTEEADNADGRIVFKDRSGRTLTTNDAFVAAALRKLSESYPRSYLPAELSALAANGTPPLSQHAAVLDALFRMAIIGMCDVGTGDCAMTKGVSEMPVALTLARGDGKAGQSWTTNMRHEWVSLDLVQQAILPLLDGQHARAALLQRVRERVASGHIYFLKDGARVEAAEDIETLIGDHVRNGLEALARSAILLA